MLLSVHLVSLVLTKRCVYHVLLDEEVWFECDGGKRRVVGRTCRHGT